MVVSGHSYLLGDLFFELVGYGKAVEHRLCTVKEEPSQYDFDARNRCAAALHVGSCS